MGFGKKLPDVREPVAYSILRVERPHASNTGAGKTGLIRCIHIGGAADWASANGAAVVSQAKGSFVGFGFRVYMGRYAFAARDESQIEIETLRVRSCIVVTFVNLDRRIAGLLRLSGGGSDEAQLFQFVDAADRRTRNGDRAKFEVHGGGPAEGEAPTATILRRRQAVHAIDDAIRGASALLPDVLRHPDCDPSVRWMDGPVFDLRINNWDHKISIKSSGSRI